MSKLNKCRMCTTLFITWKTTGENVAHSEITFLPFTWCKERNKKYPAEYTSWLSRKWAKQYQEKYI